MFQFQDSYSWIKFHVKWGKVGCMHKALHNLVSYTLICVASKNWSTDFKIQNNCKDEHYWSLSQDLRLGQNSEAGLMKCTIWTAFWNPIDPEL